MIEYTMHTSGTTRGQATGSVRVFRAGDVFTAPKGELKHMPDSAYSTRVMTPKDSPRYVVREGQQGWWKVIDTESGGPPPGDPVEGESARTKAEAQANASRLNDQ
jgi:hypothetical protein